MNFPIRINKYLRDKGLASRREADALIERGQVLINGKTTKNGVFVNEADTVTVRGEQKKYIYLAYHKPIGLATQDFAGKASVISEWRGRGLYPVGRLDKESSGLLILTNDGRLAREILSDKAGYEKEYEVTVREHLRAGIVRIFAAGMKTESLGVLLPVKAKIVSGTTLQVVLREGKRHQIRIMLNELHYTVISLKRIRIGTVRLGNLKPGETRTLLASSFPEA